jgi:hypothetical protein
MKKRKYVIIHCTATKEGQNITGDDIRRWHLSPPPNGMGWGQVGYSELIKLDGTVELLVKYNYDDFVDPWEITNGALGLNQEALHICYVGGCDVNLKPKNTLNAAQDKSLRYLIWKFLKLWPDIKFAGHNQFANKACPSFNTVLYLRSIGIPEANIHQ